MRRADEIKNAIAVGEADRPRRAEYGVAKDLLGPEELVRPGRGLGVFARRLAPSPGEVGPNRGRDRMAQVVLESAHGHLVTT